MWVVTNKGFMSIVAKDENGRPSGSGPEAIVSVRFRRKRDATALFSRYEVTTPAGDYGFRVFATRAAVAEVLMREALDIDYANFKSSIPDDDDPLHDACMDAWTVFGRLQPGGPYGLDRPRAPPASRERRRVVGQRRDGALRRGRGRAAPPEHLVRSWARRCGAMRSEAGAGFELLFGHLPHQDRLRRLRRMLRARVPQGSFGDAPAIELARINAEADFADPVLNGGCPRLARAHPCPEPAYGRASSRRASVRRTRHSRSSPDRR